MPGSEGCPWDRIVLKHTTLYTTNLNVLWFQIRITFWFLAFRMKTRYRDDCGQQQHGRAPL